MDRGTRNIQTIKTQVYETVKAQINIKSEKIF